MKKTFSGRRHETAWRLPVLPLPWAAALILIGYLDAPAQTVTTYSVNNLGDLTGFTYPSPSAINNLGQVVGGANTADYSVTHPFRTAANSPINPATDDLGLLPGAASGSATGINNLGQVSGTASGFTDGSARAFRADPGNSTLVNLGVFGGTLSGLPSSFANGINDAGQITGAATMPVDASCPGFLSHAYRTLPNGPLSTATDLGTLRVQNCQFSVGLAINASGQVAGWASSFESFQTAFLAPPGMPMQNLYSLGGPISTSYGINNAGQVVGDSDLSANPPGYSYYNGFLVNPGASMEDLGTLGGSYSYAFGINNAGQIVGSSTTPGDTASHAFLYQNGSIYDLNSLIPAGTGWVLENASAINDFGQIVGTGTLNGVYSAFRLDPAASEEAPSSGTNCNGTHKGTFTGDITVSSGQTCYFQSGTIKGNVTIKGGNLFLRLAKLLGKMALQNGQITLQESTVEGEVDVEGGDTTIIDSILAGNVDFTGGVLLIDPSLVIGNLQISNLPAGSAVSQICGTGILGNVQVTGNAAPLMLGRGGACAGNAVLGNIEVQNNTAAIAVVGNTAGGNLQCSGNSSISGSGNKVFGKKQGQCATF